MGAKARSPRNDERGSYSVHQGPARIPFCRLAVATIAAFVHRPKTACARMSASRRNAVVACAAPYGVGGLGQHLAEIVEEARRRGEEVRYFATSIKKEDPLGRVL